jgi:hypothetical protein
MPRLLDQPFDRLPGHAAAACIGGRDDGAATVTRRADTDAQA